MWLMNVEMLNQGQLGTEWCPLPTPKRQYFTLCFEFSNVFLLWLAEDKPKPSKTLAKYFALHFGLCDFKMEYSEQDFGLLIYVALKKKEIFFWTCVSVLSRWDESTDKWQGIKEAGRWTMKAVRQAVGTVRTQRALETRVLQCLHIWISM